MSKIMYNRNTKGKIKNEYVCCGVLHDFKVIEKYCTEELPDEDEEKVFWIGLRDSGVDHEDFIKYRCENDYYYRGLYKITVRKDLRKCVATLSKSSAYEFRKVHPNERS